MQCDSKFDFIRRKVRIVSGCSRGSYWSLRGYFPSCHNNLSEPRRRSVPPWTPPPPRQILSWAIWPCPLGSCSTTVDAAAAASVINAAAGRWRCPACASWTRCASVPSAACCPRRRWSSTTGSSKSSWQVRTLQRPSSSSFAGSFWLFCQILPQNSFLSDRRNLWRHFGDDGEIWDDDLPPVQQPQVGFRPFRLGFIRSR